MEKLSAVRDIHRLIRDFGAILKERHALNIYEGMALSSFYECNKLTATDIDVKLGLTYPIATKTMFSLEKEGFIERLLGEKNKRDKNFVLTQSGKEKLEEIRKDDASLAYLLKQIHDISLDK